MKKVTVTVFGELRHVESKLLFISYFIFYISDNHSKMKLWDSMKLTFYYVVCLTIVNGKVFPYKQRSFSVYRENDDVPSENYDTFSVANSSPKESDSASHDKTVKPSTRESFHVSKGVLNSNEDEVLSSNLNANGRHENLVINSDTPIVSDNMNLPSRERKSVESRSTDLNSMHKFTQLRRQKRGFRSAVADRIAHGFGKRGQVLNLDESDLNRVRNTLSQVHLGRAEDLLALTPEDMMGIESLLTMYNKMLEKLQKSSDRYLLDSSLCNNMNLSRFFSYFLTSSVSLSCHQ